MNSFIIKLSLILVKSAPFPFSIENGVTKVKIGKSLWFAKGSNLSAGQTVKIIDVEYSTFIVEPSK